MKKIDVEDFRERLNQFECSRFHPGHLHKRDVMDIINSMPDLSRPLQKEIEVDGVKFWFEKAILRSGYYFLTIDCESGRYFAPSEARVLAEALGLELPE